MNAQDLRPYQPPKSNPAPSLQAKTSLSAIGLILALIALTSPVLIFALALFGVITVGWDSVLVPAITFFGCLPLSLVALVISIVARLRHRSGKALIGIFIAILAIPVCVAVTWLIAMIGLAGHPI